MNISEWEIKDYFTFENESRKYILHAAIKQLLKINKAKINVLDFGCGDGSLVQCLNLNSNKVKISMYDINREILDLAKKKLVGSKVKFYFSKKEIPKNNFDYVVFSLVLMTLRTKKDILKNLRFLFSLLKKEGVLIIGITHPCFRFASFSTFKTSFTKKNFNYFLEGQNFKVTIVDRKFKRQSQLSDYHWTLSTTLCLIIKAGFKIIDFIELPDKAYQKNYFNKFYSPYIIITCKK
ncbi:MAG: class I SAM-dependent methyltransferase [Thermoplasmata archaeon]